MITLCPMKVFSKLEGTKRKNSVVVEYAAVRDSWLYEVWLRRIVTPTAPELIHGASGHKFGDRGYDDGADVAYP